MRRDPCRLKSIEKGVPTLASAKNAILALHVASATFRDKIFETSQPEIYGMALTDNKLHRSICLNLVWKMESRLEIS